MIPIVSEGIEDYAAAHSTPMPAVFSDLAATTHAEFSYPQMMVGPLEGRFLEMLVFALAPRLVLEIGTFTGFSSLAMAGALPPGGRIVTCDVDASVQAAARRFAEQAGVADRIEYRLGPAIDTIATLDGPFDLVFIDADKGGYLDYYEAVLPKLSAHGLIAADNTLWSGAVIDPADTSADTAAIRAFNDHVVADPRVVCVQLTIRDGVTLIRRA
jgi:caffeoyl-CoA O-methyltransferase